MTSLRLFLANVKLRVSEWVRGWYEPPLTSFEAKQRIVAFTPYPEAQARSIKRRLSRRLQEQ